MFYSLKPAIPRGLQLVVRRQIIRALMARNADVWPIDERASRQPANWSGWPEGKKFALVLTHDVETDKGQQRCLELMDIEESMGFRSSFNFVAERYAVSPSLLRRLTERGFEVGLHGLYHDGKYFDSRKIFKERTAKINRYLKEWQVVGYRSPSMLHKSGWLHKLDIEYDASTFDTDPFEPQADGVGTIFPFHVTDGAGPKGYVELPYTLPQDFTLFCLMKEQGIDIWKRKLDWIVSHGGMALVIAHPDYMHQGGSKLGHEEYPIDYYLQFLEYVKKRYEGAYWHVLPKEMAAYWKKNVPPSRTRYRSGIHNKRVCMLAYTFYETDNRVRRYAETLARHGCQVDTVSLRREGQPREGSLNGVRVFRIQKRARDEKNKFSYLYKLLKFFVNSTFFVSLKHLQHRYDLIHVHSVPDFEVFATFVAKMTGARIILDIHDIVPELYASKFGISTRSFAFKALAQLEKSSIAFSDHVIIANHIWEKTLVARSVRSEKCTTLMNYPDPSIFHRRDRADKHDKFVMIYPGTINWHQGLDIAIKAFALLGDDAAAAEFHVYGEGPMRAALQQLAVDLGLQDKVLFKGTLPLEKIAEVMSDADLGVVPKRNDAFGGDAFSTKILEFMSLGVPIVAAATRIDRHYFNDSIVSFFEPDNPEDLARAIRELIRNRELREKLAASALVFVEDYSWGKREEEYLSLVDKLVGRRAN